MGDGQIYGAPGIVVSMVFATFPHALMILVTALSLTDARLYEAADSLGTRHAAQVLHHHVPGAKYGLISAAMVVFTYAISDFGIPKVIGGNFNMLATDIFKLVIGQQDFAKGAVVGIILLVPVAVTYAVDAYVQKRQSALLSARSVPYVPRPRAASTAAMAAFCWPLARAHARGPRHGGLRVVREALAVQLQLLARPLPAGARRRRHLPRVPEQPEARVLVRERWAPSSSSSTAYLLEKTRGLDALAPVRAPDGGAADGRAGDGAGPGLHLLLRPRRRIRCTSSTARWRSWSSSPSCTTTRRRTSPR